MTNPQATRGPHEFSLCHTAVVAVIAIAIAIACAYYLTIVRSPQISRSHSSAGLDSPSDSVSDSPASGYEPWLVSGCNLRARYFSTSCCVESTCMSPCNLDLHRLPKGMLCIMFALPSWRAVETWWVQVEKKTWVLLR